ncbi:MAG: hypothetical protein Q7P63_14425 [Verrucomicrobiota bacterium JB022]|nr:hypothetical protein [Verrucomicrobiota bacterium JB022]
MKQILPLFLALGSSLCAQPVDLVITNLSDYTPRVGQSVEVNYQLITDLSASGGGENWTVRFSFLSTPRLPGSSYNIYASYRETLDQSYTFTCDTEGPVSLIIDGFFAGYYPDARVDFYVGGNDSGLQVVESEVYPWSVIEGDMPEVEISFRNWNNIAYSGWTFLNVWNEDDQTWVGGEWQQVTTPAKGYTWLTYQMTEPLRSGWNWFAIWDDVSQEWAGGSWIWVYPN